MFFSDWTYGKWAIDVDIEDVDRFLKLCEDVGIKWCDDTNALFHCEDVKQGIVKGQPRFLHNINGRRGLSITDRRFRYQNFSASYAVFADFDEYRELPNIPESCVDSLLHDFT